MNKGGFVDSLSSRSVGSRPTPREHPNPINAGRRLTLALGACLLGLVIASAALASDVQTLARLREVLPPGHYLILLQNNAEQRPSGGFLGTFATVDLASAGYRNLRVDTNIYKRDNAFTERHAIEPPAPLIDVAAGNRWAMRDSNWDLDFRAAAEQVSWFYTHEGGEPVDGVIAVNATVLQDLLKLTGPIPLPESGPSRASLAESRRVGSQAEAEESLTADNFFDTLHYKIEKEYFYDPGNRTRNEPKTILRDLIPIVQRRALAPTVAPKVVSLIEQELAERHIQLYHTNARVEERILKRGWGGALEDTESDYLLVNNASVGGQKSSLGMIQGLDLAVATRADGQLRHVLTIERTHTGDGVWPDHTNNNYVRVAVPLDAVLTSAERDRQSVLDEVTTGLEAGKTVFGVHLDTDPGETSQLTLSYDTRLREPYELLYQKQSGTMQDELRVTLDRTVLFNRVVTTDQRVAKR